MAKKQKLTLQRPQWLMNNNITPQKGKIDKLKLIKQTNFVQSAYQNVNMGFAQSSCKCNTCSWSVVNHVEDGRTVSIAQRQERPDGKTTALAKSVL